MRTILSLSDLALLSELPPRPLSRPELARRALAIAGGPTFDRRVALATIDRLTALGLVRRVGARYELSREGQCAMSLALEEYRGDRADAAVPFPAARRGAGCERRGARSGMTRCCI